MVRFKHRYLLAELIFPQSLSNPFETIPSSSKKKTNYPIQNLILPPILSEGGLMNLLKDSLSVNFGDVGSGELNGNFSIKYLSPHTHLVIFRVSRDHFRTLWAALTLLRKVGGHEVIAKMIHVSGTIRKTQHAAIAFDRKAILESIQFNSHAELRASKVKSDAGEEELSMEVEAKVDVVEQRLKESEEKIMALES